jgi:murein DD-endopeptidase MepM/ murein hydrolase activator NlpD
MISYLLKCSACIALFYLVYVFLFRHTNRFQLNRAYLLAGLMLSFVVPGIVAPMRPIGISSILIRDGYVAMDNSQVIKATVSIADNLSFIPYLYLSGVAISLIITIRSVLKPIRLYRTAKRLRRDNQMIVVDTAIQPFSFFGVMFIRSVDEDPIIIAHELVHIRQRHWIDLLLVEVVSVVLWFNPFMPFYKRSIAIQHEYIADREVTLRFSITTYLNCIARQLESTMFPGLANNFSAQSIKQRIIMVTRTSSYSAFRYLVTFPVVAILIMAFATRTSPSSINQNRELRSPVDVSKLKPGEGAGFGKRFNPTTNSVAFHTGIDFVLAAGNSVYATADGVVVNASKKSDYGNLVVIQHNNKLMTSSAHLERMLVKAGDKVESGQLIGLVGSTGLSTGPHLHFEVLHDGKAVDPVPYLNMSVD